MSDVFPGDIDVKGTVNATHVSAQGNISAVGNVNAGNVVNAGNLNVGIRVPDFPEGQFLLVGGTVNTEQVIARGNINAAGSMRPATSPRAEPSTPGM